ncbi:TetR/AcrR family transcriptional regulator [Rhodococcus sp. 14-2470-1a]|uniref:TetR/AcrR family transcriptional regulator n=1 Tax=Rhodococcus sp. 14-2470-1a TaxID=2023150 RepID=UPI000B9AC2D6|nr:TetR/AcrR family transcriptional regulator [Rhodococcus sp. 14-2470-1a]OZF42037.1 hypothetical protein CH292_26415 [Rhodococcus sp. 14-2470-1a]
MSARRPQGVSLRERTRRAVRAELMDIGIGLFSKQGYQQTKVEEIAVAAGMSERSFFRYFSSKDDLVMGKFEDMADRMAELFAALPDSEPIWVSLEHVLRDIVVGGGPGAYDSADLAIDRIVRSTPSLTARYLDKMSQMQRPLIAAVRARLGSPPGDPRPAAIVGAAFACGMAAQQVWIETDYADTFERILAQSMAAVGPDSHLAPR